MMILSASLTLLPVLVSLVEALLVVGRIQKVTFDDPNDSNTFIVGLSNDRI